MVSKPLMSLLMTLVIVTQLARIHSLSTASTQTNDSTEHSHTSMPKKSESSYLYVIGGKAYGFSPLNSTSRLSTATGEWKAMKEMPSGRSEFCGAVVDKKIYLFGGYKSRNIHDTPETEEMASNVVYDCFTNTYTPLPPMPGYDRIKSCAAAVLGRFIYVSGGDKPDDPRGKPNRLKYTVLKSLLRFDTRTKRWTTLAPMNEFRDGHQMIELDGLLYAIGGNEGGKGMEVYNATTNKWSNLLAKKHYYVGKTNAAAAHEGKIYSLAYEGFEVYSPDTDQWTDLTRPDRSDEQFADRKLVSMNGKLWAIGGIAHFDLRDGIFHNYKLMESLHSYDPSTDLWTKELQIDVGRSEGFSAFVVNL